MQVDAKDAAAHAEIQPGRCVVLAVSDTGEGVPPGEGTGLGRATVHSIVRQSGGDISVYSERGRGTTVKVYLPAADEPILGATSRRDDGEIRSPTGIETLLVAEEELSFRELVSEGLESLGYTVLQASHGAAARELCEHYRGSIDLLITMPGIRGRELAKALAALRPEMKVPYLSALEKPFTSDALARKVREVLDG